MDDLISKLSEIRSNYDCLDEDEEPYYRALSEVIKMLSQHTDGDMISRQAAIDEITEYGSGDTIYMSVGELKRRIEHLPPAQPERKPGRWIPQDHNKVNGMASTAVYYYPKCSVCGHCANYTNFCPACGADMRGETNG